MKIVLVGLVAACAVVATSTSHSDRVSGSARADFSTNELIVPCVLVDNFDGKINGQYFDIVLDKRGDALAYELSFAKPADPAVCETLANFSSFIGDGQDSLADDDDLSDGEKDNVANLFVNCEVGSDRSKARIDAKNLMAGEYYAILVSGENIATSATKFITGNEVAFAFDSEFDDIREGAEELAAGFIQNKTVTGEVFRVNGEAASIGAELGETASCLVKDR